eukprot:TRINITY_DN68155_c11_g1_i1.p1 TRINITY_DN68155_c11_g1~~TRINITY_DN68155_c11_g1_i1.p1  ORF type:complete len:226 (-),score=24.96 TRINITY_DN68155_c11_g1_i1:532-1209(-)
MGNHCSGKQQNDTETQEIAQCVSTGFSPAQDLGFTEQQVQGKVTLHGVYDVDRTAGGKALQAGTLLVSNPAGGQSTLILSYRPEPKYFQFVEKQVTVVGQFYSPNGQAVNGDHFNVHSMKLQPGEVPYDPLPTELPDPPLVTCYDELLPRVGWWVTADVTVEEIEVSNHSSSWREATVTLPDGTALCVSGGFQAWKDNLVGREVRLITKVNSVDTLAFTNAVTAW